MSDSGSRTCSVNSEEVRLCSDEDDQSEYIRINNSKYKPSMIFKVYKRRFYMLGLYSSLNALNQMCWISLASVENQVK